MMSSMVMIDFVFPPACFVSAAVRLRQQAHQFFVIGAAFFHRDLPLADDASQKRLDLERVCFDPSVLSFVGSNLQKLTERIRASYYYYLTWAAGVQSSGTLGVLPETWKVQRVYQLHNILSLFGL
jgi:hypothetical protein